MESNKKSGTVQPLDMDDEDRETIVKLNYIVSDALQTMAKLTRLPVQEVLHIVEEVDVSKLRDVAQEAIKKISIATDLDRTHILEIFHADRSASIDDIVSRLHARSRENRSKW